MAAATCTEKHSFMQRPVHLSIGQVKPTVDGGKNEDAKKVFQKHRCVSYALKMNVNGVTCVFVVHFRSSNIMYSL